MANAVRGQIPVVVGGLELTLEFTIDSLCQLEERLGETSREILKRIGSDNSLSFLRCMIWAGLLENHPGYTEKLAGELIRLPGGSQFAKKVVEAYFAAWPEPEATDNPPPRPGRRKIRTAAPDGTGPLSSAPGVSTD